MDIEHDLYNIEIAPEYWIMTFKSAALVLVTFLLFVMFSIITAKLKGHFNEQTKREVDEIDIENEEKVVEKVKEDQCESINS